jgi:hypothetical protein
VCVCVCCFFETEIYFKLERERVRVQMEALKVDGDREKAQLAADRFVSAPYWFALCLIKLLVERDLLVSARSMRFV